MFELKGGKIIFKPDNEKAAKAGGRSFTIRVDGERLAKLQAILTRTGWKNPTKATASDASKWYQQQAALKEITLKLLDFALAEHTAK